MKIRLMIVLFLINAFQVSFAEDCLRAEQNFQEGLEYFKGKQFLLSTHVFTSNRLTGKESCRLDFQNSYFQSASLFFLGDVKAFELSMERTRSLAKSPQESDRAALLRSYVSEIPQLRTDNENLKKRWQLYQSRRELKLKDLGSPELEKTHQLYVEKSQSKSKLAAGILSAFIPGAGQAYVGAYQSAAFAFIFNALLLGTTLEFSRRDLDVAAATSGVLFSMTYLGNIISAVKGASQVNESASAPYEDQLRRGLLPELEF